MEAFASAEDGKDIPVDVSDRTGHFLLSEAILYRGSFTARSSAVTAISPQSKRLIARSRRERAFILMIRNAYIL